MTLLLTSSNGSVHDYMRDCTDDAYFKSVVVLDRNILLPGLQDVC
jgi:hypothetical protein